MHNIYHIGGTFNGDFTLDSLANFSSITKLSRLKYYIFLRGHCGSKVLLEDNITNACNFFAIYEPIECVSSIRTSLDFHLL